MARNVFFSIFLIVFTLAVIEGAAFVAVQLVDQEDFFDSRDQVFASLSEDGLSAFRATSADAATGWRNFGPRQKTEANCLNQDISYRYSATGARLYDGFRPAQTQLVVAGDSYSRGDEISGEEAFPAVLSRRLGIAVANHAVGGYGPVQGLLSLEEHLPRYPQARFVVLGIMYENLYRMVNSYRPVLHVDSSHYTLKPYMKAGQVIPHPGEEAWSDLATFEQVAGAAFDEDFWARPQARFPYLLSFARSVNSNYFFYMKWQRSLRKLGKPEYSSAFNDAQIGQNLVALLNDLARRAKRWGVQPVVVFIPRDPRDTQSAAQFIDAQRAQIDASVLLVDVGASQGVDWGRYNLRPPGEDKFCHPSPYGAQQIAAAVENPLLDLGAGSSGRGR